MGLSNNTRKRHFCEVLTVENKKVRPERIGARQVIFFSNDDYPEGFNRHNGDPMVIAATIHNYLVKRILVD